MDVATAAAAAAVVSEGGKGAVASDSKGKEAKRVQKGKGKGRGRGQKSRPHRRHKKHGSSADHSLASLTGQQVAKPAVSGPMTRHNKTMFAYGNYNQHYAQRHDRHATVDPRLESLLKAKGTAFFAEKTVLDLGCGDGFLTFLAANFGSRSVVGIDIDADLISQALRYLRHLKRTGCETLPRASPEADKESHFPTSLVRCHGIAPFLHKPLILGKSSLAAASFRSTLGFPYNIEFRTENVLVSEIDERRGSSFDIVMCLNLTKWTHVNFGDDGVKVLFTRCRSLLKPGGLLVLEAQPWTSYVRKNLTQQARQIYDSIKFRPQDFNSYLMNVLGFESPEYVGACPPLKRTLQLFRRPGPALWPSMPTPPSKLVVLSPKPLQTSTQVGVGTSCSVGNVNPPLGGAPNSTLNRAIYGNIIAEPCVPNEPPNVTSVFDGVEIPADPGSLSDASSLLSTVPGELPEKTTGCDLTLASNQVSIPGEDLSGREPGFALVKDVAQNDVEKGSGQHVAAEQSRPPEFTERLPSDEIASASSEAPTQTESVGQRHASHAATSVTNEAPTPVEESSAEALIGGSSGVEEVVDRSQDQERASGSNEVSTLVEESGVMDAAEDQSRTGEPEKKKQRVGACNIE